MALRCATRIEIDVEPMAQRLLAVPQIAQQQSLWCWAACIEMTIKYYGRSQDGQCQIVNVVLQRADCCASPRSGWCNTSIPVTYYIPAYAHYGIAHCDHTLGQLTYAHLQGHVNLNRVIEVLWHWNTGGGHAALAVGWDDTNGQWVHINDPWHGASWQTFGNVQTGYGMGVWADTLITYP